jgi:hypothetical protein
MDHAYEFPSNVIDRAHALLAKWRTLQSDYDALVTAARADLLRCCYLECLGRLTPVRLHKGSDDLRCFSHVEPASISPPCPYRVESGPREHRVRKLVENDLRVQLESKLKAGPFIVSGYHDPEPLIQISGAGAPLRIRALTPGCRKLWSKPFDGTDEREEVLFFVITPDEPGLDKHFIDEHLLQRRPAILIQPAENEGEKHTWVATSAIAKDAKPVWPFDEIDVILIDYRSLFGLDQPAERFILPTPYRRAIETIEKRLAGGGLTAAAIAILRAFAGRLLVQGAAVREPPFESQQLSAPELHVLIEDAELRRLCDADPILAAIREQFMAGGFASLQRTIQEVRERSAAAEANLAVALEALADVKRKLADAVEDSKVLVAELRSARDGLADAEARRQEAEARAAGLAANLAAAQTMLTEERSGRKTLEQSVEEAKTHWLVRLDDLIHNETSMRHSH